MGTKSRSRISSRKGGVGLPWKWNAHGEATRRPKSGEARALTVAIVDGTKTGTGEKRTECLRLKPGNRPHGGERKGKIAVRRQDKSSLRKADEE